MKIKREVKMKKCGHKEIYREKYQIVFYKKGGKGYKVDEVHDFDGYFCCKCKKSVKFRELEVEEDELDWYKEEK